MSEEEYKVDDYQLINCIASGTYTQVWEAIEGGGKPFAMKLLLPEAFAEAEQKQILKHEAKVAQTLKHPNFVQFHKLVMTKEHGYILMDFFRAPNLKIQIGSDLLGLHMRIGKLVEGLCLALGYLHEQGWLHKDIKPDNILFNKSSEVRVIDFSLAIRASSGLSRLLGVKSKTIQGTRTYIAPETIRRRPPTRQTDIYSLGITIFEVLAGQPPFKGASPNDLLTKHIGTIPPDPSSFNRNVTPEMDKFVHRMLAKKPEKRHKDMGEILAEFRSLKVFKEDPQKLADEKAAREKEDKLKSLELARRLDSRADAMRSEVQKQGGFPQQKSQPTGQTQKEPQQPRKPAEPAPPAPAAQQPPPPANQPQPPPPQPAASPPYPPQPQPQPPAYYPPQYYPGYAQQPPYPMAPGQPTYAPPPYAGGPHPPQPPPPGYPGAPQGYPPGYWPQPQQPMPPLQQPKAGAQPPQPQPGAPASPQQQQKRQQKRDDETDDDMPLMDDLPPVV